MARRKHIKFKELTYETDIVHLTNKVNALLEIDNSKENYTKVVKDTFVINVIDTKEVSKAKGKPKTLTTALKSSDINIEKLEAKASAKADATVQKQQELKQAEQKAVKQRLKPLPIASIKSDNKFIQAASDKTQQIIKEKSKKINNLDIDFPYKRRNILTDAELQLYNFMKNNLCQKEKIEILAKVRLADIADLDEEITTDKKYLWKITNKHVDYLICEKGTMQMICVVELDDYSHENEVAKEKDSFIMSVLKSVGVQTFRIKVPISTINTNHLEGIDEHLNKWFAPNCPYCGARMYPDKSRRAPRIGHRFYGCPNFPTCRFTIDID